jgi:hypothetical protein
MSRERFAYFQVRRSATWRVRGSVILRVIRRLSVAKKSGPAAPAATVAAYEKLVATVPGLERKGDTMPYTSVNGNMSSYIDKSGRFALRLPEEARAAFIAKYKTKLFEAYGIVQKEYVEVPPALLAKTAELKKYFAVGYEYTKSLRPKPTTKKKK